MMRIVLRFGLRGFDHQRHHALTLRALFQLFSARLTWPKCWAQTRYAGQLEETLAVH